MMQRGRFCAERRWLPLLQYSGRRTQTSCGWATFPTGAIRTRVSRCLTSVQGPDRHAARPGRSIVPAIIHCPDRRCGMSYNLSLLALVGPTHPKTRSFHALASSSRLIASASSLRRAAPMISSSCAGEVALAIGAVILGRAISQASATCAGAVPTLVATVSRAARTRSPRALRYLVMPAPRGLFPKSFSLRYLPVRNPDARAEYGITPRPCW